MAMRRLDEASVCLVVSDCQSVDLKECTFSPEELCGNSLQMPFEKPH